MLTVPGEAWCMSRTLLPAVAGAAVRQFGAFSRAQALAAGYSDRQIRYLVRQGKWVRLRHRVYCERKSISTARADRFKLDTAAAVLSLPETVASHDSAAVLLGLQNDIPRLVTVTRAPGNTNALAAPRLRVHRAAIPATHRTSVLAIPVTSPARTVIDLARSRPFRLGVVVADVSLRLGLSSAADLERVLADCGHWPDVIKARQVVAFANPGAESEFESIARVVFAEQGLPPPETQVEIKLRTGRIARVDFLWRKYRTIVETDGMVKYTDPGVLRAEKLRQEALAELGYEIVRVTWQELLDDPAEVARRIREAFGRGIARTRLSQAR